MAKQDEPPRIAGAREDGAGEERSGDLEPVRNVFSALTAQLGRGLPLATAKRIGRGALKGGLSLLVPENLEQAAQAGRSLRDAREVAGLTLKELADALELRDESVLEAIEKGTATVSYELLLRLASLLARNDPVPFVMKYLRTYDPTVWQFLHDWGLGRLPLAFERERRFVNIYRKRDEARAVDDAAFERLVAFTEVAFQLGLEELTEHRKLQEELGRTREALAKERRELEMVRAELQAARRGSGGEGG